MKKVNFTLIFLAVSFFSYSQLLITLPTINASPGSTVTVPVILYGASTSGTPISAADIRFTFNPALLTYTGFTNFYSAMPSNQWFYSGNNTSGLISANWLEPSLLTLAVPDGTTLFEVTFTYNSGFSNLIFSFVEFTDASYNTIVTEQANGSVGPDTKSLDLKVFIQGLYNGANGLNKSQDELGDHFPGDVAEEITLELHNALTYAVIEYTVSNIGLNTQGLATISIPGNLSGSYYITVKTRNTIETTSGMPVDFSGSTIVYDFTDLSSKAFGDNMISSGGAYCLYSGDVNLDGLIDSSDMIPVDNLASAFGVGYLPEDTNGDGLIDSTDMIIVDNNATYFVSSILP